MDGEVEDFRGQFLQKHFNPDDMTEWMKHSPEEFIGIVVHELREDTIMIEKYSEVLQNPDKYKIPVEFCFGVILRAVANLHRVLDTTSVYREKLADLHDKGES